MPSNNFKVGEMLNKRTPNTKTWMNFDGSFTTEIHSGVVHFDDGLNNLHNINTSLFDEADADTYDGPTSRHAKNMLKHEKEKVKDKKKKDKMNRDDFDYQVPTLPFSIQIPKNIKKGYSIGQNDEFVRFIPQNVSPSKGYVNKAKTNEIQYQDAWNDTDIILEVTDRGIKETMVLKTDRAPFAFSFEVDGVIEDDLTMGNMKLEPAWLIDEVREKRDVTQTIRREGETTYIDLIADVEGLVYPIEIDPTITVGSSSNTADSYIYTNGPTNNYGTNTALSIGILSSSHGYETYIKFDYPVLLGTFKSAELKMTMLAKSFSGASYFDVDNYSIESAWTETGLTSNNKPTAGASGNAFSKTRVYNNDPLNTRYSFNVTKAMKRYYDGLTFHGIKLGWNGYDGNGSTSVADFASRENGQASYRPTLEITYDSVPTAPTVTTPNGGETWNSSHTIKWNPSTDPAEPTIMKTTNSVTIQSQGYKVLGQIVTVTSVDKLTKVTMTMSKVSSGGAGYLRLRNTVQSGSYWQPGSTFYANIRISDMLYSATEIVLPVGGYSFPIGTKLAIEWLGDDLLAFNGLGDYGDLYKGGHAFYSNQAESWSFNSLIDFNVGLYHDSSTAQSALRYQIQLSPDNGVNWSDIVALTSAGATQYVHDFINVPQTSTAKIRIRAFDGSAYGPWDESNGVFSIIHNVAPSAPTNLTPATTRDRAEIIRFAWQHNDPNADAQSKFDLDYRLQGSPTWINVTQNTINQFYDLPAGSLPRGTIEWRVRTYDQADLSGPYSEIKTFFAGDKPDKPTTLNPVDGSIVSVSNPTVQWSSVGQVGYNLKVLDPTETEVLWETNQTSNNKAHTVGYSLENETDYLIQLTIKNVDGINSNVEKSYIHVSYTPPAIPIVETLVDEVRGSIIVNITNPEPIGTEPLVMFNEVYRRPLNKEWIRIADDVLNDDSLTDYTPASGKTYEYFVRSWGSNETYRDSGIFQASVSFEHAQLALASDFSEWVELVYNKDTSRQKTRGRTLNQFAGRQYPLADFGDENTQSIALSYITQAYADVEHFYSIADRQETMLYRDREGRREFVTIDVTSEAEQYLGEIFSISFTVEKVWFKEGV